MTTFIGGCSLVAAAGCAILAGICAAEERWLLFAVMIILAVTNVILAMIVFDSED